MITTSYGHQPTLELLIDSARTCLICERMLEGYNWLLNVNSFGNRNLPITDFRIMASRIGSGDRFELLKHGIMAKPVNATIGDRRLGVTHLLIKREDLKIKHDDT